MYVCTKSFQQVLRVTRIGSQPSENHVDPRRTLESPAEPWKRPLQRLLRTPLRDKFPQRASRRSVPLGWIVTLRNCLQACCAKKVCTGGKRVALVQRLLESPSSSSKHPLHSILLGEGESNNNQRIEHFWGVVLPPFLWSRNSRVLVLHDLTQIEQD